MASYDYVEVLEKELEALISINADKIENGLKYLDHQKRTERGPLDVLFVDSGNALIVTELKIVEDDNMLVQGIDYYEDVTKNIEQLARMYNQLGKVEIDPMQKPRLFLIAPSFSIFLLKRTNWIDIPISLFTYRCIKMNTQNEILPVFTEVSIPGRIKPIEVYTYEQRLSYFRDEIVKVRFTKLIEYVKSFDERKIAIDPIKYDISIKVNGKVISYFCPRRKNFIIYTYDTDSEFKPFQVNSDEDLPNIKELLRLNYDKGK